MRRLPGGAAALLFVVGCSAAPAKPAAPPSGTVRTATPLVNGPRPMPPVPRDAEGYLMPRGLSAEDVTVECSDGYRLAGSLLKRQRSPTGMPGLIFLHDEGKERHEFYPLTVQSAGRNYAVLALDLRGHGECPRVEGNPPRTATTLTDADWASMVEDVRNAVSFLAIKPDVDGGRLGLVGSGLGADLALVCAAQPWAASVLCVVAVSPVPALHGLDPVAAAAKLDREKRVYVAAAKGDATSYETAVAIANAVKGPKQVSFPDGDGHGVKVMGSGIFRELPAWLYQALTPPSSLPGRGPLRPAGAARPAPRRRAAPAETP